MITAILPAKRTARLGPLELAAEVTLVAGINAAYEESGYSLLRQVDVHVVDGMVRLEGVLPSYFAKQLAQEIARHVPGVKQIENAIEVLRRMD